MFYISKLHIMLILICSHGQALASTTCLTPKISSDQIWVAGYFGQRLTYPYFIIFISNFCVTL
jgi:hypothetical protein